MPSPVHVSKWARRGTAGSWQLLAAHRSL